MMHPIVIVRCQHAPLSKYVAYFSLILSELLLTKGNDDEPTKSHYYKRITPLSFITSHMDPFIQ